MNSPALKRILLGLCLVASGLAARANNSVNLSAYTDPRSWSITPKTEGSDPGVTVTVIPEDADGRPMAPRVIDFADPDRREIILHGNERMVTFAVTKALGGKESSVYFDIEEIGGKGAVGWLLLSFEYPKEIDPKNPHEFDSRCRLSGFFIGDPGALPYAFVRVDTVNLHLLPNGGCMCGPMHVSCIVM